MAIEAVMTRVWRGFPTVTILRLPRLALAALIQAALIEHSRFPALSILCEPKNGNRLRTVPPSGFVRLSPV